MPIYEYYCAGNHTVYQFYAKTLAQGQTTPRCPDNPKFKLRKLVSAFAVTKGGRADESATPPPDTGAGDSPDEARMEAAMGAMEKEFSGIDENDPRAMGRMMRKMAEVTGEPIAGEMEEVVRKLEEGTDPEALESQMGGGEEPGEGGPADGEAQPPGARGREPKHRFKARQPLRRDPKLYDYE
ncbi:MAG: FmdB family transcriptional regulator [Verrucomicrobia bacterium]|nr:FmdB family transcriptional regulator [Verrucomicrobiota bacterium]